MPREFFQDGDTLMVKISVDSSSVVTRPATAEEEAGHKPKPKAKAKKSEEGAAGE